MKKAFCIVVFFAVFSFLTFATEYHIASTCVESINEEDHTIVIDEYITMPTCTEMGIAGTRHCSECGKRFEDEKAIPALGHDEIVDDEIPPTCLSIGFTEGSHCRRCNEIIKAQLSIPATGHNPSQAANCQRAQICLTCGITLTEKTEHNYVNFVCSVCQSRNTTPTEGIRYQKYKKSDGTVYYSVIGVGTATERDIVIPKTYEGIPVTEIHDSAFRNNANITSIWLPNTIESIGWSAFYSCYNLEYINVPDSVKHIENYAFYCCSKLKSEINIPIGITEIGERTFCGCYNLKSVILPEGLITIGDAAFDDTAIESINIPSTVETLGYSCFSECDFDTIVLPAQIATIGENAFSYCMNLTTVYLPRNTAFVKDFDKYFTHCPLLKAVYYDGTCLEWWSNGGSDVYNVTCIKSEKPTDHYVVTIPAEEATCTKTGLTEGARCAVCNKIIVKQAIVPADEHTYADGICNICGDNIRDFSGGNGTEEYPYLIMNKEQLNNVRNFCTSYFVLTASIVFEEEDFSINGEFYNSGKGWLPISSFSGSFDGRGFSIKNLYINSAVYSSFIISNQGTIKNLNIENIVSISEREATDSQYTAGVYSSGIVVNNRGVIERCSVSGIINSRLYSENTGLCSYAGGIAVDNQGIVKLCSNHAIISAHADIGKSNTRPISAYVGGIAAKSGGESAMIENCYNSGEVFAECTASLYSLKYYIVVGGIVGYNYANVTHCYNVGSVDYNMSAGRDLPSRVECYSYLHGIGSRCENSNGIINECYFLGQNTLAELTQRDTFVGFDFENVWRIDSSGNYPYPIFRGYCPPHEFGEWHVSIAATCTATGIQERVCKCGERETEILPALGHDLVAHEGKTATCTEIGWDAYETCTRCDYTTYKEIPALGHFFEKIIVREPTTALPGEQKLVCKRCEYSETREIPILAPGDINGDGEITVFDALTALRALLNGRTVDNADMNGDGKLSLLDIIKILRLTSAS